MVLLIFFTSDQFCQAVCPILPGSPTNFEIGIFLSLSDFVQCDVRQSDAYKNLTDSLAKLVRLQKSDWFWLFHVNDPLGLTGAMTFGLKSISQMIVTEVLCSYWVCIRGSRGWLKEPTYTHSWKVCLTRWPNVFLSIWPTDMASSPKVIWHVRFQGWFRINPNMTKLFCFFL